MADTVLHWPGDVDRSKAGPHSQQAGLAIGRAGAVVTVSVHGCLNGDNRGDVEHVLYDLICEQGNLHVAVDVENLTHADRNGVSLLIDARRLARRCGAALTVRNASQTLQRALDAACVEDQL